jgi:hypothetical protein
MFSQSHNEIEYKTVEVNDLKQSRLSHGQIVGAQAEAEAWRISSKATDSGESL